MASYAYIIVGGGMAADAAVGGILAEDKSATVGLFSSEAFPPYKRPPLSKKLWTGGHVAEIWCSHSHRKSQVAEHLTTSVMAINTKKKQITCADGQTYGYGKLLLATGGTPRRLFDGDDAVVYYRTLDDYFEIWRAQRSKKRFLVIGGGFIGAEMAAALRMQEKDVRMLFPDKAILSHLLPAELAQHVTQSYHEHGVEIESGQTATSVQQTGQGLEVKTESGQSFVADCIVAGIGITPNVALAEKAGIDVKNGILVDDHLRTSVEDVYAAGDVANFEASHLGRQRVEHEDNAVSQGERAGRNMAGAQLSLEPLPLFYSDLFDMGFEAVGMLDSSLTTVANWKTPMKEGVVCYLREGRLVGTLNWNVWDGVQKARELILSGERFEDPKAALKRL